MAGHLEAWLEEAAEVPEPPEVRAGFMTMAEALSVLAEDPSWRVEAQGDLQVHTTYSDGKATLEEMVDEAACFAQPL